MIGLLLVQAFGDALGVRGFREDRPFRLEARPVQPPDRGDGIPSAVSTYFIERERNGGYNLCCCREVWREGLFGQPVRDGELETAYPRTLALPDAVGWLRAVERLNRFNLRGAPGISHWSRYENPGPSPMFDDVNDERTLHNLTLYGSAEPPPLAAPSSLQPRV